jgi:TQXA domain-containing protein/LPXTG-motif cell wall-anchored protein
MSRFVRAGAALTGTAAILMAVAAPAAAAPATGKVDPSGNVIGYQVNVGDDWLATIPTNLLGFTLADGTDLGMYCVEIHTDIDGEHDMVEQPWNEYPSQDSPFNTNRTKINWVLHHGYPALTLEQVAAQLPSTHDGIDVLEAVAATQAAVWHFSDGVDLDRDDPLSGDASDEDDAADALALYDFLTGPANTGIGEAPLPTLSIAPATLEGQSGSRIGPFTVSTNATVEQLAKTLPDGVKLVDDQGNELTGPVADGAKVYVDVPAGTVDGDGGFELTASASLDTGRLFVGENYAKHPTQSLIVAAAVNTELTASAGVSWKAAPVTTTTTTTTPPETTTTVPPTTTSTTAAPVPQAGLAETGASVFTPIVIGLVLVGAGIGTLLFLRRRRSA